MPMKITMNLAISQSEVGDQKIDETTAQWFHRLPYAQRRFINLHFYAHDSFTGPNATEYPVAKASITDKSPVGFRKVMVFDAPLLDGLDFTVAMEIRRVQGMDTMAAFDVATAVSATIFLFKKIYSGSTVSILGRVKQDILKMSEFPVVSGTGVFRGHVEPPPSPPSLRNPAS